MADSKKILSKRSLRRHIKKGTDAALAALHPNKPTHFRPDTPPSATEIGRAHV